MLKIYNTQTRQKQEFVPIKPNEVNIYVCGMTVYDFCHVGHARVMVFFDTVVKHLQKIGYKVNYVRNITDIDDKIIMRANQTQEDFLDLVNRFIKEMHQDSEQLNIAPPTFEPRATTSMQEIITMIAQLVNNGSAYVVNGDVYFEVSKFSQYGKLSGKKIDQLLAGARVEVNTNKKQAVDFALWKAAKPDEPCWDSPWGKGRPGWHIECSAMAQKILGNRFDIHGGGMDLIFPHHENEIAQSEMCVGHQHVNLWMHVGFVRVEDEKMSKSLGNFFTIKEVLKEYQAEVIRLFLLSSHYRNPLNYTKENLNHAQAALSRLYKTLLNNEHQQGEIDQGWQSKFNDKMNDDFNTPEALAVLFDLVRVINRNNENPDLCFTLRSLANTLGILTYDPEGFFKSDNQDSKLIDSLIDARNQARQNKDYQKADLIREQLSKMNVTIEDSVEGTKWFRHN